MYYKDQIITCKEGFLCVEIWHYEDVRFNTIDGYFRSGGEPIIELYHALVKIQIEKTGDIVIWHNLNALEFILAYEKAKAKKRFLKTNTTPVEYHPDKLPFNTRLRRAGYDLILTFRDDHSFPYEKIIIDTTGIAQFIQILENMLIDSGKIDRPKG